jgi:2-hydroxy-3-keto-5-methylthiopentenyl-1-phosphate phosphatase
VKHKKEESEKPKIAVFCDFDGTVTKLDLGDEVFKRFGEFEPYHTELRAGRLNIREYWQILCSSLKPGIDRQTIADFADECEVDPYFAQFVKFCSEKDIPVSILSDGFDVYIEPVLKLLGLDEMTVFCNKLIFNGDDRAVPVYQYASESCECLCASCKRNAMLDSVDDDTIIVFAGDDYSDFCAAEHSDIVFAKKALAAWCNEKRIPHYPYSNFFDVIRILGKLIEKNQIKIRHQAKIKRMKAFETE